MTSTRDLAPLLLSIPPFLLAITVHEVAHGYMAYRKGDHTARLMGRLSFNPLRHIDPIGTVLFPLMLILSGTGIVFGWAKPVPINPYHFRSPRKDMVQVSLAGPASNLLLALACAAVFRLLLWGVGPDLLWTSRALAPLGVMVLMGIKISLYLGVFNILPVHPLDGSHILEGLLPHEQAMAYSRLAPYGWLILLALMFTGILYRIIGPIYNILWRIISGVFGI